MKIHYKHKGKNSQLIGNALYANEVIDIYLNEKKIPATIEVQFSDKYWNQFIIPVNMLFSLRSTKNMLALTLLNAYNHHINKTNSSVG